MVIKCRCVVPAHTSPIFIAPQDIRLTAGHWDLVPELGAKPLEGSRLCQSKSHLHPLHQGLHVLAMLVAEVAGLENRLVKRICTSQADSAAGLWS